VELDLEVFVEERLSDFLRLELSLVPTKLMNTLSGMVTLKFFKNSSISNGISFFPVFLDHGLQLFARLTHRDSLFEVTTRGEHVISSMICVSVPRL